MPSLFLANITSDVVITTSDTFLVTSDFSWEERIQLTDSSDIEMVFKALIRLYRRRLLHLRDNVIASKIFNIPNGKQLLIKNFL